MGSGEKMRQLDAKALSTLDLLIAGMSYMAPGFSLFFTTALIAGVAGISIPIVYFFAGLGVLCTGAALAEFSKIAPSAGSLQVFLKRGFGNTASTAGGIVLLIGYLCLQSAVAALFGGWTAQLLNTYLGLAIPWTLLTILGVAICTAFMVRGVGLSIKTTWILFLIEFVLVLLIALAVVIAGGNARSFLRTVQPSRVCGAAHGFHRHGPGLRHILFRRLRRCDFLCRGNA